MVGHKLRFRRGICGGFSKARAARDSRNVPQQLKLVADSAAGADAEPKAPQQRGLVETWYSGGYVAWPGPLQTPVS